MDYSKETDALLLKGEVFKPCTGYEDYYQVSNYGRVKSIRSDKILKQSGVSLVAFSVDNKRKTQMVSHLVFDAFLRHTKSQYKFIGRKSYHCICHLNKDHRDNRVENLSFISKSKSSNINILLDKQNPKTDQLKPFQNGGYQKTKNLIYNKNMDIVAIICTICGNKKTVDNFYKEGGRYRLQCKSCRYGKYSKNHGRNKLRESLRRKHFGVCTICKEIKRLNNFGKDKNRPDGRDPTCKECKRKLNKKYKNHIQ